MTHNPPKTLAVLAAPIATTLLLGLLTTWAWRTQINLHRTAEARHTADVCYQASRRVQVLVDFALKAVRLHAREFSLVSPSTLTPQQLRDFSAVLLRELPGCQAVRLFNQGNELWRSPPPDGASPRVPAELLRAASSGDSVKLSPPIKPADGATVILAALPLKRGSGQEVMVMELDSARMIGSGFRENIRSEFTFKLQDGATTLFRFPDLPSPEALGPGATELRHFPVANRTWSLTIEPRAGERASVSKAATLTTPLLGYFLSLCVGLLVHLLYRRMTMYRAARDQALTEVEQRKAAQRALRDAETRYHGVFDSATDGLLVLDDAGQIMEANPQACDMSGHEAGGLAGRSMQVLFDNDRRGIGVLDDFLRQVKSFGAARLEAAVKRGDGSVLNVEIRGTTLKYDGAPRLLAILTDVSDLKQAVERHTQLSRKVLMTQEEERRRISRDLHDELGQILTALHLELDWIREESTSAPDELQESFGNAAGMVESAAEELRRICRGLRPPLLDDLGLEPAIRLLIEEEQGRTGLEADVAIQLDDSDHAIAPDVALCVYRVLQESLHNIRRHASASSVSISLSCSDSELCLSVYDDGVGFDMGKKREDRSGSGFGIAGMRERAFLIHGTLDVRSEPHQGTRVTLRAPLDGAGKEMSE